MVDYDYDFWVKRFTLLEGARRLGYRVGVGEIAGDVAVARFRDIEQALHTVQIVRHDESDRPLFVYLN